MTTPTAPLAAVVNGLTELDPTSLTDAELDELVVELHRIDAQLTAVRARVTAVWDAKRCWAADRYTSGAACLAHRCGLPGGAARNEVRMARHLRTLPAVDDALAAGDITLHHARAFVRLDKPVQAEVLRRDEAMLVDSVKSLRWRSVQRVLRYWEQHADPDGVEDVSARLRRDRSLYLSQTFEGQWVLNGTLDPVAGAEYAEALSRIETELFEADWALARAEHPDRDINTADLPRSAAQRRADAQVEMARRATTAPAHGKRPKPLVTVLVGYETFAGRVCELADGIVVTPGDVARVLSEDALIERVVFDGPARVIEVGEARLFKGALRRAIEVRDRHCTGIGCDVPADRCDVDHEIPHAAGGPTTQRNGRLRCPFHNPGRRRQRPPPEAA